MKTKYEKLTAKYQKDLMKSLQEFVAINSTYDESTVSQLHPFGEGVSKALNYIANLAANDGFEVQNYDNKVVEIIYGRGEKNLTIMAHADVVPAGSTGWENDPFKVTEKKGILYGRGVADDKGPLLSCYYALKALRDNGELGGYQIRFLVGGNEESGSLCMEHYFKELKKPQPTLGFSPDSDFPLIFAEKGIINFEIDTYVDIPGLISLQGGLAPNAVIEKCIVKHEIDLKLLELVMDKYSRKEASISTVDDVSTITFTGLSAHGSTPELGVNAGMMALSTLAKYSKNANLIRLVRALDNLDGSGYGCGAKSKEMGHNSSNVGLISYEEGLLKIVVNFRYVDTCNRDDLVNQMTSTFKPSKIKILGESPLLYYPKDSVLVSTLLKSYQDETGDLESKPLAIGGGTYAKEADNVVAFGMQFPGWDSAMHAIAEKSKKDDLFKAMSIYARAIIDLGKLLTKDED